MKIRRGLALALMLAAPAAAEAQQDRMLLEAGIVGGNSPTCPGHYMGIEGRVIGPAALYGMIETYRCTELPETSSRLGGSVRLVPVNWLVRPALQAGVEYSDVGQYSPTFGASLTFGRRYGARFVVDRWRVPGSVAIVLFQIGGYVAF